MGAIRDAGKFIKSTIHKVGAELDTAWETVQEETRYLASMKDLTVPTVSIYVREDIGIGKLLEKEMKLDSIQTRSRQITGVYIPPSVKAGASVNVILYMHGNKVRLWDQNGTIRDYWGLPALPLRQGLKTSGKPFILVAPTLGFKAGREFGDLGTNIDDHLDHVLAQLPVLGAPEFAASKPPGIDQLIIAGHSGAFGPISSILKSINKYKDRIKEIWAFDIMSIDMSSQLAALGVPVYAYFVEENDDTKDNSHRLARKKLPNVFVMKNVEFDMVKGKEQERPVGHDFLMREFWLDRCRRMGTNGSDPDDKKRMVQK